MPAPRYRIVKRHEGCYELQVYGSGRKWLQHTRKVYGAIDEIISLLDQLQQTDCLDNDVVELPLSHGGLTPRES